MNYPIYTCYSSGSYSSSKGIVSRDSKRLKDAIVVEYNPTLIHNDINSKTDGFDKLDKAIQNELENNLACVDTNTYTEISQPYFIGKNIK